MPGKKPKLPKGFIDADQVASAAGARGFEMRPKTISIYSHSGKLPFGKPIPGRVKGRMFAKADLDAIIRAMPKKALKPAGAMTVSTLVKVADAQKLKISPADIKAKLIKAIKAATARGEKRRHPGREFVGLQTDMYDSHHRLFIPRALAEELLLEARRRKNLPRLLASGELVRLSEVATDLGLQPRSLHNRPDITTERIGNARVVARAEAERFKGQYLRENGAVMKEPRKKGARKEPRKKKKAAPKKAKVYLSDMQLNEQTGRTWMDANAAEAGPKLRARLQQVINVNINLPPGDFNQMVLSSLERNLREGQGRGKQ